MQLFRGRVLVATGIGLICLAAAGWLWKTAFFYLSGLLLLSGGIGAVLLQRRMKRMLPYRVFSLLAALGITLLFLCRLAVFYLVTYAGVLQYAGETHCVECTVTERLYLESYASGYRVQVTEADGKRIRTKAVLDCGFASDYTLGTQLYLTGTEVGDASADYVGNVPDGILLTLQTEDREGVTVIREGAEYNGWREALRTVNRRLAAEIREAVGGEEGVLCARMLLGGTDTDTVLQRDFRRAGLSHLLAVSGMHLSLLVGAADRLLFRLRCGKRLRIGILSCGIIGYLCLLDFPVSAVRSGLMLLLSYGLFLFSADCDGLTSLLMALSVILFFQPSAVLDSGFILSAGATFGILSLAPLYAGLGEKYRKRLRERQRRAGKTPAFRKATEVLWEFFLRKILPSFAVLLSANAMTAVPVALLFGKLSLLSPVSNLPAPFLAELCILLSVPVLLLPEGCFLRGMSAFYAKQSAKALISLASRLSDIRGAEFSLRAGLIRGILIAATALTLLFLCVRLKRKWWVLLPYAAGVIAIAVYACGIKTKDVDLFFTESGTDDAMVAVCGGTSVLADFSSGSGRMLSQAVSLAEEAGATEVEVLLLTHYHAKHTGTVEKLLQVQKVRRLWMPEPQTQSDASVMLRLAEIAEEYGAECSLYTSEDVLTVFGTVSLRATGPERISRSTHPVLAVSVREGENDIVYLGKSAEEGTLPQTYPVDAGTQVVYGQHGPVRKQAAAEQLADAAQIHIFQTEQLPYLVSGGDPERYFGKIRLHEKTAYFRLEAGSTR